MSASASSRSSPATDRSTRRGLPAGRHRRAPDGRTPARALEQYLILTIDHGFNASTFTARVVASTGADIADVVGAALGALAGPLHGGAPEPGARRPRRDRRPRQHRGLGRPPRSPPDGGSWASATPSTARATRARRCCASVAVGLGGDLVDQAIDVEGRVLATLRRLKPDRPLPSNVEFFAGVVMASAGLPRALFTPTFAVSRSIGWVTHAVEQAAIGKLIRPSAQLRPPASPGATCPSPASAPPSEWRSSSGEGGFLALPHSDGVGRQAT